MIKIRKLQDGDIEYVRINPLEEAVKNYPEFSPDPKNSYTVILDDKIVGVGGIMILWEGVGELWLILTKDSKREGIYGLMAFDAIRKKIDEIIEECNIYRAQAPVRVDFHKAIKMMEALNFENETPNGMKNYCPDGCDVYMYARIKKRRPNGNER